MRTEHDDRQWNRNTMRRIMRGAYFPEFTDPASRHVRIMADSLMRSGDYPMLTEEPEHCAGSLLATVEALWKARKEIARLRAALERDR